MTEPKTLPKELVAALPCLLGVLWQGFQPEDDILAQPSAIGASIGNPILVIWLFAEFIRDCFGLSSDTNDLSTPYQVQELVEKNSLLDRDTGRTSDSVP